MHSIASIKGGSRLDIEKASMLGGLLQKITGKGQPEGVADSNPVEQVQVIDKKAIQKATETLKKYKDGKKKLEDRIVEEEQWWKLRHWDVINNGKSNADRPEPTSAWLLNSLSAKHADIMDNYPECTTQPHSCLQLRPKQLPPPLHPSSSPHDNFLQHFLRSWYLPDTTKRRACQVIQGLESGEKSVACPGAKVHTGAELILGLREWNISELMECSGISSCGGKKHFLKKQSCLIS